MNSFTPFTKDLSELNATDLAKLRSVAEGWHVEYKRNFDDSAKIAKSLASFANSYGGLIVVGVTAGHTNTPEKFDGLSDVELSKFTTKLTETARHVTPTPYYRSQIIRGPNIDLGLPADASIILMEVPAGRETPYIHSSGRIYVRKSDSSDPSFATDRHTLDLLCERRQGARNRLAQFLERTPQLTDEEKGGMYLRLFLLPDPYDQRGMRSNISFAKFREISASSAETYGFSLANTYSSNEGFVARSRENFKSSFSYGITLEHDFLGRSILTLPISSVIRERRNHYEHQARYEELCSSLRLTRTIDINLLLPLVSGFAQKHIKLNNVGGLSNAPIFAKARLLGAWRYAPFLDTAAFMKFVETHGPPVILTDNCFCPPNEQDPILLELNQHPKTDDWHLRVVTPLVTALLIGCGVPKEIISESANELGSAILRAVEAHRPRQTGDD